MARSDQHATRTPARVTKGEAREAGFSLGLVEATDEGLDRDLTDPVHRRYLFLHRGRGEVELDEGPSPIQPGSIVKAPAGGLFRLRLDGEGSGMLVSLSEDFIRARIMEMMDAPPGNDWLSYHRPAVYDFFTAPDMRRRRDEIMRELRAAQARLGGYADAVVAGYVLIVLFQPIYAAAPPGVMIGAPIGQASRDRDLVMDFRALVDQNVLRHLSVGEYCEALGVGHSTLAQACRAVLTMTPLEYINSRLILEAKRALQHSSRRIDSISYDLGFNSPGYFTRFFKRHTGAAPSEFRRPAADDREPRPA